MCVYVRVRETTYRMCEVRGRDKIHTVQPALFSFRVGLLMVHLHI